MHKKENVVQNWGTWLLNGKGGKKITVLQVVILLLENEYKTDSDPLLIMLLPLQVEEVYL